MQVLEEKYMRKLEAIATAIQESPLLAAYHEEEEEDQYNELRFAFEPAIAELHHEIAMVAPLELNTLEHLLLDENFEGLYLPRILGFAVLRNETNSQFRYVRPNDHFKDILLAICQSVHFDQLRKRIGQSIQVGFALSSDIWITNLLSQVENKRIRHFLQQQKNERFWDINERSELYLRYSNQFRNEMYFSADFPESLGELKAHFSALRQFLLKRFEVGGDNSSLKVEIQKFLENKAFQGHDEYMEMLVVYGNFMAMNDTEQETFKKHFKRERKELPEFDEKLLRFLLGMYRSKVNLVAEHDERMGKLIDKSVKDRISDYYRIAEKVHSLGYVHPEAIEAVEDFYNSHEGLAVESECLHQLILNYFQRLVNGLSEQEYTGFFELTKIFGVYMRIFANERFNLSVEAMSMNYIHRLLKVYIDKRGKDYQDIKKFVSTQFVEMKFLKDKEVTELFKSRRKKKQED